MPQQITLFCLREHAVCGDGGGTVYCGEIGPSSASREAEGREAGSG